MNQQEFERLKQLVKKYHEFLFSLPGLMAVGYNDKEISIDIKPERVELARQFVSNNIEGVPVKIRPRSNPPSF